MLKEFLFKSGKSSAKPAAKKDNDHYLYAFWDKGTNHGNNLQSLAFGSKGDKQHDWEEYLKSWKERHPDE